MVNLFYAPDWFNLSKRITNHDFKHDFNFNIKLEETLIKSLSLM